jgi:hypothetical protein
MLDASDALNGGPIDRHYCVTMDVNRDNRTDIICGVGAVLGTGDGYTELYLTQPDGSVQKMLVCAIVAFVLWAILPGTGASSARTYLYFLSFAFVRSLDKSGHGLQKYPTTRHRIAVTLKNLAGETKYVLFATKGLPRPDGKINGAYSWVRNHHGSI